VLLSFLIGNDFLPHLPYFHINEDVLPTLFDTLKATLAACDGYITDNGVINMRRLEVLLRQLSTIDHDAFVSSAHAKAHAKAHTCPRTPIHATLFQRAPAVYAACNHTPCPLRYLHHHPVPPACIIGPMGQCPSISPSVGCLSFIPPPPPPPPSAAPAAPCRGQTKP